MKNSQFKKGVSLIAVLLFMLVATIAATATFKWLTSSGASSSSQMMQKEAYQSAVAGLENARTWMTYHANDVGSLIKQYKDGGNKAISLNSQLRALSRAGQEYDTWLVGVNTSASTYKLKILSSGRARNGSVHNEVGIFNVDGLYQVNVPQKTTSATVDFDYAYFGGTYNGAGSVSMSGAVVNGNWNGNPQNLSKNFVVTGTTTLSGNDIGGGQLACFGGDVTVSNQGLTAQNVYVHGSMLGTKLHITGDARFDGKVSQGSTGALDFDGSVSIYDTLTTNQSGSGYNMTVDQHLCIGEKGKIISGGTTDVLRVDGNVWSANDDPLGAPNAGENYGNYDMIIFGNNTTSKVYMHAKSEKEYSDIYDDVKSYYRNNNGAWQGYHHFESRSGSSTTKYFIYEPLKVEFKKSGDYYNYFLNDVVFALEKYKGVRSFNANSGSPYCEDAEGKNGVTCNAAYESCDPFLAKYYGNASEGHTAYRPICYVRNWFKSNGTVEYDVPDKAPFPCGGDSVKVRCDSIWKDTVGCDGSQYRVKDILSTIDTTTLKSYASLGCAKDIKSWESGLVSKLNKCFTENDTVPAKKAANLYNGYLVVHVSGGTDLGSCPSGTLNGKFIIFADDEINCQNGLPGTTNNTRVFLYLKKGASNIKGGTHYFIYSQADIGNIYSGTTTGTIYVTAKSCAKVGNMFSNTLETDSLLLLDLANAGVICNNVNDQSCGSGSSFGSGSASGTTTSIITLTGTDSYYIANAPQLSVTLETEYKSTEALPQASQTIALSEDFIVLPRVIYMTRDPYGKLADYYNVIPLNGLRNFKKEDGTVTCSPGDIPTSGDLYNHSGSGTPLANDYYSCQYAYGGKSVPFYVLVNGESGSAPSIYFTESNVKMGSSVSHEVKLHVPAHSNEITVNVVKPSGMDESTWSIHENGGSCSGSTCTFKFGATTEITEPTVFTATTSNAGNGTAIFQLLAGEGYTVSTPSTEVLYIASSVTINREDIPISELEAYCAEHSGCPADLSSWPNCPATSTWVTAVGNGCTSSTPNNQWNCGIASDIALASGSTPAGCIVIVPSQVLAQGNLEVGGTYSLPASAKALAMKFYFGFSGEDGLSGKEIIAKITNSTASGRINTTKSCVFGTDVTSTADHCEMTVFKGESVELYFPGERPSNFNYWSCSGTDCPTPSHSGEKYNSFAIMNDGDVVIAHFDETDRHCFFDEFKTGIDCSQKYCIGSAGAKWRSEDISKIDYRYGYVAAGMNKNDVAGAVVMSTAEAGLHGTLKAQFQVPRVAKSNDANIPASISNSGFIIHSTDLIGTDYLSLSFYADKEGTLTAKLCNKNASTCSQTTFTSGSSSLTIDYTNTVITLSADVGESKIDLTAYTGALGASTGYTATFDLSDGYADYKTIGQYVGFRLADPNFKLYDIGWKSEDYGSTCWDTYPTVNCSFNAAYSGGFVPEKENVTPWVGLSSWFDAKNCEPHYYYNGSDGNCGSTGAYTECASGHYFFEGTGAHGYKDDSGNEIKTAKAGVGNCFNITGEEDRLLAETEWAHCGPFWVGTVSYCKQNVDFSESSSAKTISAGGVEYFNLSSGVANLRQASLKIEVRNEDASKIEIFMVSQQEDGTETFLSKSMVTTSNGTISVDAESLSDADGFDIQSVLGVAVKVISGEDVVVSNVYTTCPNVVSIECSNHISYNANTGKWEVSADVTNYSSVKSMKITEESSQISQKIYNCESSECPVSENIGTGVGTYSFEIADNPYATSSNKTYKFNVELTTKDNEVMSCRTNEVNLSAITATCGSLSATEAKQGKGVPQFTYSMSNCPSSGCPYVIKLLDESGTEIVSSVTTGSANVSNGHTSTTVANSSTKLNLGKYKFSLSSTSTDKPFTSCVSEEFEVIKNPDDYKDPETRCWFNNSEHQLGSTAYFKFDVGRTGTYMKGIPYKLVHIVNGVETVIKESTTSTNDEDQVSFTASPYGLTYTLYVNVNGEYEEACSIDMPIKETSASSCSLENGRTEMSATDTDKFVFNVTNPCTGSVCSYSLKKTLNGTTTEVSSGNPTNGQYKPTITGPGVYTLWINGVEQTGCSITVTGKRPSFTCSDKYVGVGDVVSFTPSNLTECDDGCTYSFHATDDETFPSGMSGTYTGSEIAFNGRNSETTENYTLTITNGNGSNSCTFDVTYASNSCTTINWPASGDKVQGTPTPNFPWSGSDCYIVQSDKVCFGQIKFKSDDCKGRDFTWNGVSIHLRESDGYLDMNPNPGPGLSTKIEGMGTCRITQFWMDNCQTLSAPGSSPSIGSCPIDVSGAIKPGTSVTITPTSVNNCKVLGGCEYSITGGASTITGTYYDGKITIPGESYNVTANYSLTFTNSVGTSSACTFSVTYDSNARTIVTAGNPAQVLGPGKYRIATCYGNTGTKMWQFETGSSDNCLGWFGSSLSWSSHWNTCNGQVSATFPINLDIPEGGSIKIGHCW